MLSRRGFVVVFSGPSGVGKTTVARAVLGQLEDLAFSISVTTRPRRAGEEEGVDYLFRSREEFSRMLETGELLEWTKYCGFYYGTPARPLERWLAAGTDVLLDVDARGAAQVRRSLPASVLIFLLPPDHLELERRIVGRGAPPDNELAARLSQARIELAAARQYDYVVVNDQVERAAETVKAIVRAERCRVSRLGPALGLSKEEEDGVC